MRTILPSIVALLVGGAVLCDPDVALAAEGAPHLDGSSLGLWWAAPFAAMLLSIALLPLMMPHFWHHHFGKVAAFWALCFLVPALFRFGPATVGFEVLHTVLLEYVPFVILLFSLFTVAGGVRITGALHGSPLLNTALLGAGAFLASWMGTTGAAMLLIRPLIRANERRRHKVHTIIFFIFLVANIGGSLTPLGDPPLFLGFLKGVSFFWTTQHLLLPMLLMVTTLLSIYFCLDYWYFRREEHREAPMVEPDDRVGIEGKINILLLVGVVGAVLMSGLWPHEFRWSIAIYHVPVEIQNVARDALLLLIAYLSWKLTSPESRTANAFNWFPIIEVGKLFFGIFMTIIPAIAILRAGAEGALAPVVHAVTDDAGMPINSMYFLLTGLLSSFLDNAPTYLVFFNTAGGDAHVLMSEVATLMAISCGAVFMGANTYVGNAPNFMVKSIAEERGVKMPSFFGYMLWAFGILGPLYAVLIWLFFL